MAGSAVNGVCVMRSELVRMMTRDPDVSSCLSRICNTILLNDIELSEGGAKVTPKLTRIINREYKRFFKDAIVLTYLCGFVPYYLVSVNNVKMPRCLAVGSFSWRVRERPRAAARQGGMMEYEIRMLAGTLKESDVLIHETVAPVVDRSVYELSSPISGVLDEYLAWKQCERQSSQCNEWNEVKHIAVVERIDVKDQTTSGIQLLDEQRRYNLTGQHNNVVHNNLLRLTGAGVTHSVAEAFNHAVHSQFQDHSEVRVGSKRAAVHILPPNTEVQELGSLPTSALAQEAKTSFQKAVYVFFGLPNINHIQDEQSKTRSTPSMHREQYSNILHVQNTLERLGESVYARSFGLEADDVVFRLRAMPRFDITSVDDIKTLCDIQMLTPADMNHLRKTIMNQ